MRPLLARLSGAEALLRLAASDNAGGFGMSEMISAGMRMMAVGLNMEQIHSVSCAVLGSTRELVGAETVAKTVVAFPNLSQFM